MPSQGLVPDTMSEREVSNERTTDRPDADERRADRTDYRPNPDESGKWLSAIIALLGVWMIVEAVAFDMVVTQFWNDVLVGALLLAVGGYNYYRRSNEETASVGAASIAALLGAWLIITPFVLGADAGATETVNDLAFWNDVIVGLAALVLGAYSAYAAREEREETRRAVS